MWGTQSGCTDIYEGSEPEKVAALLKENATVSQHVEILNLLQDQYYFIFLSSLLAWSPNGDDSLIRSLLIGDTSTTYITDVATRVTTTLY